MMPTLYIAGPMRGIPKLNWPEFDKADKQLRDKGFYTINPAVLNLELGFSSEDDITDEMLRRIMLIDLQKIADNADAIALMYGWYRSKGCRAEVAFGDFIGIDIHPLGWWLNDYNREILL